MGGVLQECYFFPGLISSQLKSYGGSNVTRGKFLDRPNENHKFFGCGPLEN